MFNNVGFDPPFHETVDGHVIALAVTVASFTLTKYTTSVLPSVLANDTVVSEL